MNKKTKWVWIENDGKVVNDGEYFESPEEAIEEMNKRLGHEYDLKRLKSVGLRLSMAEIEVKPTFVMEEFCMLKNSQNINMKR